MNVLLVPINISLPYDPTKDVNSTPPSPVQCRAIWDTGATNSVITKRLVQSMGLIPTGKGAVTNTGTTELRNTYLININLPSHVVIPYVKVTDCEDVLGNGNADMLVGMDVIARGDFAVTYENDKTIMSFIMPPVGPIDYVPISDSENQKLERAEKFETQKRVRLLRQSSKKARRIKHKKQKINKKKNHRKH